MPPRQDFCKTCGLFAPCPTCGKGRATLSVVPSEPAYTEAQIRSAFARAWSQCDSGGAVSADDLIGLLEGGT